MSAVKNYFITIGSICRHVLILCGFFLFSGMNVAWGYDDVFDLGTIALKKEIRRHISLENKADVPLMLKKPVSSCECLTILNYPDTLPPHSKKEFEFALEPSKSGEVKYEITVEEEKTARAVGSYVVMAQVVSLQPKRDLSCSIPCDEVTKMRQDRHRLTIIDVREASDFAAVRIPGSVNMPLYTLKTRLFDKNETLVLLNGGDRYQELDEACGSLRERGMKCFVLDGGLNAWHRNGQPLEYCGYDTEVLSNISALSFHCEKDYINWLVIDVTKKQDKAIVLVSTMSVHIPFADKKGFAATLGKVIGQSKRTSVLIVSTTGAEYGEIEKIYNKMKFKGSSAFYLENGLNGYRRFLLEKDQLLHPQRERTAQGGVVSNGMPVPKKPCSSCP